MKGIWVFGTLTPSPYSPYNLGVWGVLCKLPYAVFFGVALFT